MSEKDKIELKSEIERLATETRAQQKEIAVKTAEIVRIKAELQKVTVDAKTWVGDFGTRMKQVTGELDEGTQPEISVEDQTSKLREQAETLQRRVDDLESSLKRQQQRTEEAEALAVEA